MKRLILTLVHSVALLLLLVLHILIPKSTRGTILFGVRVPRDAIYYPEVEALHRLYRKRIQTIGAASLVILSCLVFYFDNLIFQILSVFIYMAILFLIYLSINSRARKLKREKNWDKINSQVIIRDGEAGLEVENRSEDDLWILGNTIYCNPQDPSVFIRKRTRDGWTINLGRPIGMALAIAIVLALVIIIVKLIQL